MSSAILGLFFYRLSGFYLFLSFFIDFGPLSLLDSVPHSYFPFSSVSDPPSALESSLSLCSSQLVMKHCVFSVFGSLPFFFYHSFLLSHLSSPPQVLFLSLTSLFLTLSLPLPLPFVCSLFSVPTHNFVISLHLSSITPSLLYLSLLPPSLLAPPCSRTIHILSSLSACSISLPAEWMNREMNELAFMPPCVSSCRGQNTSTPPHPPAKVSSVERKLMWSSGGSQSLRGLTSSCQTAICSPPEQKVAGWPDGD